MTTFFDDIPVGYNYEDLTLRPIRSSISSRKDVDLSTEIVPGTTLRIPIIASPMTTISESKMMVKMYKLGGLAILHRFCYQDDEYDFDYLRNELSKVAEADVPQSHIGFSVGVKLKDKALVDVLASNAGIVCIDVNIGHHEKTIKMVEYIKEAHPHLRIIAGSVSTFEGARDLCLAGADCIRATNGGGSACTTLQVTGTGLPTATSLRECVGGAKSVDDSKTVIADGGHKYSSSMVIALALGANAVMIGGALAGSSACPENAFFTDPDTGDRKARYFGMASRMAQGVRGMKPGTAPEGVNKVLSLKGKTSIIIEEFVGGIRSGCSFCNASNLKELKTNAQFVRWR